MLGSRPGNGDTELAALEGSHSEIFIPVWYDSPYANLFYVYLFAQ